MEEQVKRSLTEGPIRKSIIFFALPMFLSSLFQQLYNTVDTIIVGHFLPDALASVSSSGNLTFLMIGFFQGLAIGAGVVISKYFGAKDYQNMKKAIHTDVAFGFLAGILLSVVGCLSVPFLLKLLATPEKIMPYSVEYFRMYCAGAFTIILYNIFVGILQAVGDSKRPLYYLVFSSVLNVLLDLLFVGVFRWGVFSAALATVISQGVSAFLCFIRLVTCKEIYRVDLKEIRFHKGMLGRILRYGLPTGVQNSIIAIANLCVQRHINSFDNEDIIAGVGCYAKLEGFAFLPITCFSMALTTFIGQNLGAKEYDRAKAGAKFCILCSFALAEIVGLILFLFGPFFLSLFTKESAVIANGAKQMRIEAFFYGFLALTYALSSIFRGSGRPYVPMIITLLCWCVIRVVALTLLLSVWHDIMFVYIIYPSTWILSTICLAILYIKSDWVHFFDKVEERK